MLGQLYKELSSGSKKGEEPLVTPRSTGCSHCDTDCRKRRATNLHEATYQGKRKLEIGMKDREKNATPNPISLYTLAMYNTVSHSPGIGIVPH